MLYPQDDFDTFIQGYFSSGFSYFSHIVPFLAVKSGISI